MIRPVRAQLRGLAKASLPASVQDLVLGAARHRADALSMLALQPLTTAYLPWSSASMRPSAIRVVLNDIVVNKRRMIVECGGGISTVFIARLLAAAGGHLHTIESDAHWADYLHAQLEREGLAAVVSIVLAPLEQTSLSLDGAPWYSPGVLDGLIPADIDLLIVDGPPAHTEELRLSRYPAVGYFRDQLAADFTIVADDADRASQQLIVARWECESDLRFTSRLIDGSIFVARSRNGFAL